VKNLESRSQLLEAALSSADEANRRWEECRSVVDTLRIENTQLRAEIAGLRAENASLHAALTNSGASYAQQQQIMHEAAAAAKEIVDVNGTGNGQEGEVNKAR
jgi:predicted RNase H-like nuclease (RuvC/YqgF family)